MSAESPQTPSLGKRAQRKTYLHEEMDKQKHALMAGSAVAALLQELRGISVKEFNHFHFHFGRGSFVREPLGNLRLMTHRILGANQNDVMVMINKKNSFLKQKGCW